MLGRGFEDYRDYRRKEQSMKIEQKAHAKYSASGSARWMNCPGSLRESEDAPPPRESEYAKDGTEAHECLEYILKNRVELRAAVEAAAKKYKPDQVTHAISAMDWIMRRARELERRGNSVDLLCETRVDASSFTCADQFGTLDAAIVQEFGKLIVIDYKYGAGIAVDPEENTQMIYYALGIAHQYHYNFQSVELVIIQPRAFHESGETIRTWECSMDTLMGWAAKFKQAVVDTYAIDAPLKAGSWCKFCPAALGCTELRDKAIAQAQIVFDDEAGVDSMPAPTGIAIKNLGTILDACDKIESWMTKVREHALHVLERGEAIDGFKLVEKRSIRKWANPEASTKAAQKLFGKIAFTEPELLSPAQLEKAVGSNFRTLDFIKKNVTAKSSGVTIARDTDKRPAVIITSALEVVDDLSEKEETKTAERNKKSKRKKIK